MFLSVHVFLCSSIPASKDIFNFSLHLILVKGGLCSVSSLESPLYIKISLWA